MCFVCGYKIVDFCDFAKVVAKYLYTCLEFFSDPLKDLEKKKKQVLFLMCLIRDKMASIQSLRSPLIAAVATGLYFVTYQL